MGTSGKRFRIAFSFAGEKRDFVAKVADILAKRFGEGVILYDKYHLAEFSRSDLAFNLPDLYEKESELIVAVLCSDYEDKEWCGLEWNAIYGLLKAGKTREIMLTRFERVEGKGLRRLAGYTDLDDLTSDQAASLILERLALNEGHPKDHYKSDSTGGGGRLHTSTPNNLPRLQSFFGRERELAAIREALDPESRTWGALIDGPGGIGKTSLAIRAAYDCPPGQFQRITFVSLKSRELDDDGVREIGGFLLSGLLEMLNELARELGQADIAKAPEDQRIRLLLDALRFERVLLVLDNLESLTRATAISSSRSSSACLRAARLSSPAGGVLARVRTSSFWKSSTRPPRWRRSLTWPDTIHCLQGPSRLSASASMSIPAETRCCSVG
jgi:hypothetical protein